MVVNEVRLYDEKKKRNKGTKTRGIQYILYCKCAQLERLFNENHTVT